MDLTINGWRRQVSADPATSLLDVLRAELGLTGARTNFSRFDETR